MADGIALIGAGTWGRKWLRLLLSEPDTRLTAVCDPDEDSLAWARETVLRAGRPVPLLVRDVRELADLDDLAGAVVASPIASHVPIANSLLASGRHVLVEKPLATTRAEAVRLVRLAETRGLSLAAGHTFLYSAGAEAFRDILASGRLGDLRFIASERANYGRFGPRFGPLWELAVHDVALLLWWLGTDTAPPPGPVAVACVTAPRGLAASGPEDYSCLSLAFGDGPVAFVSATWAAPVKTRRTLASGSLGMAVYEESPAGPVVTHYPRPSEQGAEEDGYPRGERWPLPPRPAGEDPLTLEYRDWRKSWTSGTPPRTCARQALAVVTVLEAASLSAALGGRPVSTEEVGGP